MVAVVFGVVAYRERPPASPGAVAAEVIGLAAVLAGVFFLARSEGERVVPGRLVPVDRPGRPDGAPTVPRHEEQTAWE
jgi:hypothetical protein